MNAEDQGKSELCMIFSGHFLNSEISKKNCKKNK